MDPRASLVDTLRRALAGRDDVQLAVLFGSEARGTAAAGSDVDLAVLTCGDPFALAADLSAAVGREVDLVSLGDEIGVPLLGAIVRDGVCVHESRRGSFGTFLSRALATLETDRPWYRRMADAYLARLAQKAGSRG